jgi:hypothetical protein
MAFSVQSRVRLGLRHLHATCTTSLGEGLGLSLTLFLVMLCRGLVYLVDEATSPKQQAAAA